MNNHENDSTLAHFEVEVGEYLVERAKAGAAAELQMIEAETTGAPVWGWPSSNDSAVDLLEVWEAVKQFPPDKWWRKPQHPG